MKFYGHNPKTHLLDLGGNPDLDPDPGCFEGITVAVLTTVKGPRRGFGNSSKIRRLADLKLNKLKTALGEVCALRVLLVFNCCIRHC